MRLSTPWRLGAALALALLCAPAWAQSYTQAPMATPGYTDISTTGTRVLSSEADTGISIQYAFAEVASGFSFPFFGVNRSIVRIASDGFVSFSPLTTSTAGNPTTVSVSTPNDFVAAFWDDLDDNIGTGPSREKIYYRYDSANSRFIVQWTNAYRFNLPTTDYSFQTHLLANGNVELHYGTMTDSQLASATAGVENSTGTAGGFLFAQAAAGVNAASNTSFLFTYVAPTAVPATCGTVNPPATAAGASRLTWPGVAAANDYVVRIGTTSGGTDIANDVVTAQPFFGFSRAPGVTYFYSVTPRNTIGVPAAACAIANTITAATPALISSFPYTVTFGTSTSPPAGWTQDLTDSSEDWAFSTASFASSGGPSADHTSGIVGSGAYGYVDDRFTDNDPQNLVVAPLNFSGVTSPRIQFWYQNAGTSNNSVDVPVLLVESSTDGTTWTTRATVTALTNTWVQQSVSLNALAGQSRVFLRFRGREIGSGIDNFLAIDDVVVSDTPTAAPNNATLVAPADAAADVVYSLPVFTWTAPAPVAGAAVEGYKLRVGLTAGAANVINDLDVGNVTTFTLRGQLAPGTTYFWTVLPFNTAGTAAGATPFSFTTAAATVVTTATPFSQDFTSVVFPPTNWLVFDNGVGTVRSWSRNTGGFAESIFESVGTGLFAIDYFVTPALTIPAAGATLRFKNWQGSSGASTYRVLISTGRQFPATAYQAAPLASWSSTVACTGPGAPPTVSPGTQNCSFSLSAYAGQTVHLAFVHENNNGFSMFIDDVQVVELGPTAFAFTPNVPAANFSSAGTCAGGVVRTSTFSASNSGGGTLNVTSVVLSGSSAFAFQSAPATGAFGEGGGTSFQVNFNPSAAQTGPQTGTLTVTYDLNGGATQTRTVGLYGSGDGEGAGFVYRGTNSPAGCENGLAAPGTALITDGTGGIGTRITTLSADDITSTLALGTVALPFGPVRMFGVEYTSLQVNSNGAVALGTTPALPAAFSGALVSPAGINLIQPFANDLNMNTTTYDTADPGTFTPGVYSLIADADGDGASDDLVLTWYHAYNFGSLAYATTANPAQYMTGQLVFIKAPRANEEDIVEVRFIDGVEPVSNVPYRLRTTVLSPSTSNPFSLEGGMVTAVSEAASSEASLYRFFTGNGLVGLGGPVYAPGGGSIGVRFQAEAQASATGQGGYRMMGVPVHSYDVGRLSRINLVQNVVGQYLTGPGSILYTGYNGTTYTAAADVADIVTPGRGFFWRLYNQNITPTSPAPFGAGTSRSFTLPMKLEATGAEPALTNGAIPVPLITTGDKFNLVANPFRDDLDVSTIGSWATGGVLASAVPQVWDPNVGGSGSYVPITSGSLSTWQGFFIENSTATALNIPVTARNATGTFLGRSGALYTNTSTGVLAFELAGTDAATGSVTLDRAATLAVSDEIASDGWDLYDASKLAPLAVAYATVGFQGVGVDGAVRVKAQESRATDAASFDVPLVVDAVGTAPGLTLSWAGLDAFPETWALELRDVVTGATVDLRQAASYTFDQTADPALDVPDEAILARTTTAAQAKAGTQARFVLHVTTGRTTGTEAGTPTAFALAAPAPNPTTSSAVIAFDVPEATAVTVAVYDLLGRRVAVLLQGEVAAGRHAARLAAGSLAPGVYVVRMTAGTFAATQRMTVVR